MNDHLPHLIVFGSRTFKDVELLVAKLNHYTQELGKLVVVVGDATGADAIALGWAVALKHTRIIHYADWDKHKKAAGPIRNQEMVDSVAHIKHKFAVGVWDGSSRGTADMIGRVKKADIPLRLIRFGG